MYRAINNNRGFALGAIIAAMFLLSTTVVVGSKVTDTVRSSQKYFASAGTKNSLAVVRDFIIQNSGDPDNDGHYELLKEGPGHAIPLSIPVSPVDSYGTAYYYCTWDAGIANPGLDPGNKYSQNNFAPPNAGMIGRIISAGSDKTLQTGCTDTAANGDDIMLDIMESAVNYSSAALGGWKDNGTYMAQLNPARQVIVGSAAVPTHALEVMGGNVAASGLAIGNVEIFNSVGNTAQINVTGGALNVNAGSLQMSGVVFVDSARNVTAATFSSTGNGTVGGTLTVTGATFLNSALTASGGIGTTTLVTSGLATLNSLGVTGNETVGGTLTITGATFHTGAITANGGIGTTTLSTSGLATLNSAAVTGNATVGGNLSVTGTLAAGTITSGVWNGTAIGLGYGGTGANTAADARPVSVWPSVPMYRPIMPTSLPSPAVPG